MKSKEAPYIFIYSNYENRFESTIEKPSIEIIKSMRLRARFNTQRDVKVYGLLATDLQIKKLNKMLDTNLTNENDSEIFLSIKDKLIDIGF
jgi:hypothetical protein